MDDKALPTNYQILIAALLEVIYGNKFTNICEYLIKRGILTNNNIYSDELSSVRNLYVKHLSTISDKMNILSNDLIKYQYQVPHFSRYQLDFREIAQIGKGAYGRVSKAINNIDGMEYAIKKIRTRKFDYESNNKILREVKYFARLDHRNIVRYYGSWLEFDNDGVIMNIDESDEDDSYDSSEIVIYEKKDNIVGVLYIQMELCIYTLKDWMNITKIRKLDEIKGIMKQICDGVKYIHSMGLIHRDLKPTNIYFDRFGTVKIGDFGLVTINKKLNVTQEKKDDAIILFDHYSSGVGTELYASPEQLKSNNYDNRTDIYSLGIIYFELLYPFGTEMERVITINKLRRGIIPNDFPYNDEIKLINNMICFNPDERCTLDNISFT